MTERVASCLADPNFAVICSFLERFAVPCGISHPNFLELQEMLENTEQVPQPLIDLHVKLLRKARKSVSLERWERAVVKFCHTHACGEHQKDGWDIERLGYVNLRVDGKLRVLKLLLEHQFDLNSKFKAEVNRQSSAELRLQPFGRDKLGQNYWLQQDEFCNLKVYREDADNDTWEVVASDRESLVELISKLSDGNLDSVFNSEDSNSQEGNENIDTGQDGEDSTIIKSHGNNSANKIKDGDNSVCEAAKNRHADIDSTSLSDDVKKEAQDNSHEQQIIESSQGVSVQSVKDSVKGKCEDMAEAEDQPKLCDEDQKQDPLVEDKSNLEHLKNEVSETENSNTTDACTSIVSESYKQLGEEAQMSKTEGMEMNNSKRKVSDLANRSLSGSPVLVERESKRKKCGDEEFSDTVEEKTLYFSGEGSGKECEVGNPCFSSQLLDISEAIEEPVMYFYGVGFGSECETGNPDNSEETEKSDNAGESAKIVVKKLEEEAVSSTNGSVDDVSTRPNRKSSDDECFQNDSGIDFLKTGFFFGPGTLAAKDKIPMGPMDDEGEPLKTDTETSEVVKAEVHLSKTTPSVSSQQEETQIGVKADTEKVVKDMNPTTINSIEDDKGSEVINSTEKTPSKNLQLCATANSDDVDSEAFEADENSSSFSVDAVNPNSFKEVDDCPQNVPTVSEEQSEEFKAASSEESQTHHNAHNVTSSVPEEAATLNRDTLPTKAEQLSSENCSPDVPSLSGSSNKSETLIEKSTENIQTFGDQQETQKLSDVSQMISSPESLKPTFINCSDESVKTREVNISPGADTAIKSSGEIMEAEDDTPAPIEAPPKSIVMKAFPETNETCEEDISSLSAQTSSTPVEIVKAEEESSSSLDVIPECPSIETTREIAAPELRLSQDIDVSEQLLPVNTVRNTAESESFPNKSHEEKAKKEEENTSSLDKVALKEPTVTDSEATLGEVMTVPPPVEVADTSECMASAETIDAQENAPPSHMNASCEVPADSSSHQIEHTKPQVASEGASIPQISDLSAEESVTEVLKPSPKMLNSDTSQGDGPSVSPISNIDSIACNEMNEEEAHNVICPSGPLKENSDKTDFSSKGDKVEFEGAKGQNSDISADQVLSENVSILTEAENEQVRSNTPESSTATSSSVAPSDVESLKDTAPFSESDKLGDSLDTQSKAAVVSELINEERTTTSLLSGSTLDNETQDDPMLCTTTLTTASVGPDTDPEIEMSSKDSTQFLPGDQEIVSDSPSIAEGSSSTISKSESAPTDCNEESTFLKDGTDTSDLSLGLPITRLQSHELPERCSLEVKGPVSVVETSEESLSHTQDEQDVDDGRTSPQPIHNVAENISANATCLPSSCSEEACLDDDPPAITTLEEAMRQMEAAGAPVCLDDSDEADDDGQYEETTEHGEEKPEEEEEEEEKSFFVFEGSIGGWKHATTGRKDEENKDECEDDMFSDLPPLASPPASSSIPQLTSEGGEEKKPMEGEKPSPRRATRSSRRRGGLPPVEGVDVSDEPCEAKDDSAAEKDPLAISDEDSKGKNSRSRRGRKRRNSDPLESPESHDAEAENKRAKLRGRRPLDRNLRTSVEEQRAGLVDASSEDVEEMAEDPLHESEDEQAPVVQAPRRGGWRGRRGRGRRGGRGRGRGGNAGITRQDTASTENADVGDDGAEKNESPEKAEKKPRGKRKSRMLAELQVDLDSVNASETAEEGRGVRTSRRIAQIRLKEQAERREMEEAEMCLKERYKLEKEARKAAKLEKRRQRKEKADNSDSDGGIKKKKKKHKKEKQPKFNQSMNVWNQTSSGSSSSSDSAEDEIPEPSDDDVPYVVKSDHEFSPESDVNDEEYQPTRRARTARRDKEAEAEPEPQDYPCKKCGKSDQPEWMLLCDKCDAGWHCSCLRPALLQIPEGDWFCPPCQHTQLVARLQEHLQSYDVDMKRLASEEARRKFMSFVDISVENILPEDLGEKVKKKKKKKFKHRERRRGKLRRCQIIESSDEEQGQDDEDSEEDFDNDDKNDPDAEGDSDVSSSSESSSGTSTSETSSSSSSSPEQSSDGSEPIYQLRQRRQTNVNYRFNEYDDLIKSAIQDGIEDVEGGGEADVPTEVVPDTENLPPVKPVPSAGKRLEGEEEVSDEEEIKMKKPQRRGKYLTDEEEEEEPEAKVNDEEEDEEEEEEEGYVPPVVKKSVAKGKRKKHRPLTALEVSSTSSDPESDEDFKGSSAEEDEGDEESLGSVSDSDDSVVRSRRRGGPVRRSGRNRMTRYDRDFIDDDDADYSDDSDAPRKKKTRKQSSERRAAKRGRTQPKSKVKKTKKKVRKNDDSDKEVRIKKVKPKLVKQQVESGSESDTPAPRRTRGRRMDYRENDSSEEEAAAKKASKLKHSIEPPKSKESKESKESVDSPEAKEEAEITEKKSEKARTHPRMKVTPLRSTTAVSITPSSAVKAERPSSVTAPSVTIIPTTKKSSTSLAPPAQMKTPSRVVAPGIPPSITAVPINPETKVPVGVSQTGIRTLKELQQLVTGRDSKESSPTGGSQNESPSAAQPQSQTSQQPQPQLQPQTRIPSQSVPQTMPQSVTPSVPQSIPQGIPQQIVTQSGVLQTVPQGISQGVSGVPQGMASGVTQVMPQTTYPSSASGPLMAMQALAGESSYPYQHYYHQPPPHAPYLPNPHHTPTTNPSHISSMPPHHPSPHHPTPHLPTPHHSSLHPSHHSAPHHPAPHHPSPHHASSHMMSPHHPNSPHLSPHHSRLPHHGSPHHHLPSHLPSHPHHAYPNPAQHALSQQHVGLHGGPQGSPPSNSANPSIPQPSAAKYEEEGRSEFGGLVSYFSSQHDDMEG